MEPTILTCMAFFSLLRLWVCGNERGRGRGGGEWREREREGEGRSRGGRGRRGTSVTGDSE